MVIYAIHAIGTEFVKIGIANGPDGRLCTLQTGSPYELVLLGMADWPDSMERYLHGKLGEHHVRGEWFRMTPPVLAVIEHIKSGHLDTAIGRGAVQKQHRLSRVLTYAMDELSLSRPRLSNKNKT